MSLFPRRKSILTSLGDVEFTEAIQKFLANKDYNQAADALIISSYSFNHVALMLGNCPPALSTYLYKYTSSLTASSPSLKTLTHLYLNSALPRLQTLDPIERKEETSQIKKFISDFRTSIDYPTLKKTVERLSLTTLLDYIAIVFQDYKTAATYLLQMRDHDQAYEVASNMSPFDRRQIYLKIAKANQPLLLEKATNEDPMSLFDSLVETSVKSPSSTLSFLSIYSSQSQSDTDFEGLISSLRVFLGDPSSNGKVNDRVWFVVERLTSQNLFKEASEICSLAGLGILAVELSLKVSLEFCLTLLATTLKKRECWLSALRLCSKINAEEDWTRLVESATGSRSLTLEDILPFVPEDMPLDSLRKVVAKAVEESSNEVKKGERDRISIEKRSESIRQRITETHSSLIKFEPDNAVCIGCGLPAVDTPFIAFPCGHFCHVHCSPSLPSSPSPSLGQSNTYSSCRACGLEAWNTLSIPLTTLTSSLDSDKWSIPK